jgi:hypothetical protein
MGELIKFPGSDPHEWRAHEAMFRKMVIDRGGTAEAADWIVADMQPRWKQIHSRSLSVSFDAPAEASSVVHQIIDFFGDMGTAADAQLFFLECELYTEKFDGPPILPPPDMQVTFEVPKPPKD